MNSKIALSLWFDNQAKEAMEFYVSIFQNSQITAENPVVVAADLSGVPFIAINGGPIFKPNASISFMVISKDKEEISKIWNTFLDGGNILMPLDTYPWSSHYGWISDKYGFNWQLYFGKPEDFNEQKIVPTAMYCGSQQGKCKEAITFYEAIFPSFKSQGTLLYPDGPMKGQVQHAQYLAENFTFMAMDSGVPQNFTFNEGISYVIYCENQEEIDYYWDAFTKDGAESMCGWCKDPFGLSWQVVPKNIGNIFQQNPNAGKVLLQMKKIIIKDLINA